MSEDNFILRFSDSLKRSKGNRKRQSGQGVLEYALILVFIALTAIVILTEVGGQAGNTFSNVSNSLGGNKVNLSSYNDEFTSSWSGNGGGNGWTVLGSQASIDSAETNTPGLTITASTPGSNYCSSWDTIGCTMQGVYKKAPSEPFTVTTEVNASLNTNWQYVLLFVGDADVNHVLLGGGIRNWQNNQVVVATQDLTTNTDVVASHDSQPIGQPEPIYLQMVVHSDTNIDVNYSLDGSTWTTLSTGITNPNFSGPITTVGLAVMNDSNQGQPAAVFDWIRFTS